jgi:hypothetical protein
MLFICHRFGYLFLLWLVWQYSTNQNQYKKGRFKVMTLSAVQIVGVLGVQKREQKER